MPRETIDSILEDEIEVDVAILDEPATVEFEFELDSCDTVTVCLSSLGINSREEFDDSHDQAEAREMLADDYEIVWTEDGEYYLQEDTFICQSSEERYHTDVERMVIDRHGDCISVHEGGDDYVYCEDTEETYLDDDAASANDVHYCHSCEETRSSENHDFDECENGDDNDQQTFDNSSSPWRGMNNDKYSRGKGISSTTFSNMNGMRYTFGVEIETSDGRIDYYDDLNCSAVNDGSISGKEYVTGVLVGDSGLSMLKKICDRVNDNCSISSSCGIHVHIGGATFNRRFTIMATHLGLMLQDEMFSMLPPSRASNSYCKKIPTKHEEMNFNNYKEHLADLIYSSATLDKNNNKKSRLGRYPTKRYTWLNMVGYSQENGHNTIEFRPHSASMNYVKIRNWVLICMAFTSFVENHQRRIWEARKLPGGIKLDEVLRTSLGDTLGGQISRYVESRKSVFEGAN
mgnify:CR=1 FL=1